MAETGEENGVSTRGDDAGVAETRGASGDAKEEDEDGKVSYEVEPGVDCYCIADSDRHAVYQLPACVMYALDEGSFHAV